MGTMDDAWKIACLQKKCRYCDKPAEEWKGGIYYCKKCYEEVIVKQKEKEECSAPSHMRRRDVEHSKVKVSRKKPRKIKINKWRLVK